MNHTLSDVLAAQLEEAALTPDRWQAILARLYATGVIVRDESGSEARAYDDARRVEGLLGEYFSLAGFRLLHNPDFKYFRLYPPGAVAEGEEGEAVRRLRARASKDFAAFLMVLRELYTCARDAGSLNELLECPVSLEEVHLALARLLRMQQPPIKRDRLEIYEELSKQRLVRLPADYRNEPPDMQLSIRVGILDFVSEAQLLSIRQEAARRSAAELPQEPNTEEPAGAATAGAVSESVS
jgi:hypothetical protein